MALQFAAALGAETFALSHSDSFVFFSKFTTTSPRLRDQDYESKTDRLRVIQQDQGR